MAWIESHQTLRKHPKLLHLCELTTWSINEAVGILHSLWWWTLDYAEDGDLSRYSSSQIALAIDAKLPDPSKLFSILIEVKFMRNDLKIHDWWNYAGRYLTAKYKNNNPSKLLKIERIYKRPIGKPKGNPTGKPLDALPNLPNIPNIPKEKEVEEKEIIQLHAEPSYENKSAPEQKAGQKAEPKKSIRPKKPREMSDEEWLGSLKRNKAYEELDIDAIHGKMLAWCELKGKKPTRARLLNWLNREEKPMQKGGTNGTHKHSNKLSPEPSKYDGIGISVES